jgi:Rieske Fe-S protein
MVDRREFIRRVAVSSVFVVIASVGFLELFTREAASQTGQLPTLPPATQTAGPTMLTQTSSQQQTSSLLTSQQATQQTTGGSSSQTPSSSTSSSSSASTSSTSSSAPASSTTSTSTSGSSSQTTQQVPQGYIFVAPMSALAGKSSAYFNHPSFGLSLLLNDSGSWKAFNAACTHAGCTVQYTGSSIYCPCHSANFSPSNGAVVNGPPPSSLPEYGVLVLNGSLYVTSSVVN